MIDYRGCRFLLSNLINTGFPELTAVSVNPEFLNLENAFMQIYQAHPRYKIKIDESMRNAPEKVFIGCLAHELGHASRNCMRGEAERTAYGINLKLSPMYQTRDERETDRLTIRRGYGKELLSFLNWTNKNLRKYGKRDGLTAREILWEIKSLEEARKAL